MAEMEMAYANTPIGLAMLSRDLRYIRINKLLPQINGLSADEHYGKTIYEAVPDVAKQAGNGQVVGNLLSNAAKYTPEGGHIILSAVQENGNAVIRVTDNGIGIANEMLPKIFDMFVR